MKSFLKRIRTSSFKKGNLGRYILYAIGEVLLITIGVLIAVNINKKVVASEHQKLRCHYLDELDYTFEFDIKDVQENISAFEEWNPKINALIQAIENKKVSELDSIEDKINTVRKFIFFNQRSTTKVEELKYSNIDLIGNRRLKNKMLLYQDEKIAALLQLERKYNLVDEEIRKYYSKHFYGESLSQEIIRKPQLLSLCRQKFAENLRMKLNYEKILKEQFEIKELIEKEKEKNCHQ